MKHHFREFDLTKVSIPERQELLLSAVAPRPIALTGTMDAQGRHNLAPFSFFNAFGSNPATIAISPALGGRDGLPKHTYLNILATGEFSISIVSHALVEKSNWASYPFPLGVDEFEEAGLTKLPSLKIKPPGVAESPCVLECKFIQCIELGGKPGSGNLMIGEVVFMRFREDVFNSGGHIDPMQMDQVARMGQDWYTRANLGLFPLPKPKLDKGGK